MRLTIWLMMMFTLNYLDIDIFEDGSFILVYLAMIICACQDYIECTT